MPESQHPDQTTLTPDQAKEVRDLAYLVSRHSDREEAAPPAPDAADASAESRRSSAADQEISAFLLRNAHVSPQWLVDRIRDEAQRGEGEMFGMLAGAIERHIEQDWA